MFLLILTGRGCLPSNWKPSFLPLLIFNWRTFSRWVTAHWWRQWAKNQVLSNQNSRNRWCQIVRRTIWIYVFSLKIVNEFICLDGTQIDPTARTLISRKYFELNVKLHKVKMGTRVIITCVDIVFFIIFSWNILTAFIPFDFGMHV